MMVAATCSPSYMTHMKVSPARCSCSPGWPATSSSSKTPHRNFSRPSLPQRTTNLSMTSTRRLCQKTTFSTLLLYLLGYPSALKTTRPGSALTPSSTTRRASNPSTPSSSTAAPNGGRRLKKKEKKFFKIVTFMKMSLEREPLE